MISNYRRQAVLFTLAALVAFAPTAQGEPPTQHSAGVTACSTNTPPYTGRFTAWGRSRALDGAASWWELWSVNFSQLDASGEFDSAIVSVPASPPAGEEEIYHAAVRWAQGACFGQGLVDVPTGVGARPAMKFQPRSVSQALLTSTGSITLTPHSDPSCVKTEVAAGTISVRRSGQRVQSRPLRDICELTPYQYRRWPVGAGLAVEFDRNAITAQVSVGLHGPRRETVRVALEDVTGQYQQQAAFDVVRVDRPDVQIWEGSDAYFNYCLQGDNIGSIRSEGGRLYCWRWGVDTIRVTRR